MKSLLISLIMLIITGSYLHTHIRAQDNKDSIREAERKLEGVVKKKDFEQYKNTQNQWQGGMQEQMKMMFKEVLESNRRYNESARNERLEKFDSIIIETVRVDTTSR